MSGTSQQLRDWAKGSLPLEAATELLIRAFGGCFSAEGHPWVVKDKQYGNLWIDFEAIPENVGGLSGGEKRFLLIVASLGGSTPLVLNDAVPGLDRGVSGLVLAAVAHAAGSHQDSTLIENSDGSVGFDQPGSLYPWPPEAPALRLLDGGKEG